MTWMPFVCLGAGFLLAWKKPPERIVKAVDQIVNCALVLLMVVIGMNIGVSDSVIGNLGTIGLNCAIIALLAIGGSVLWVVLLEKTLLPLEEISQKVREEQPPAEALAGMEGMDRLSEGQGPAAEAASASEREAAGESRPGEKDKKRTSPLIWIMPAGIVAGILAGYLCLDSRFQGALDKGLLISLIFLYTGVGFSMGVNKAVFRYVRRLGIRVLLIPAAIFLGSGLGGLLGGLLCGEPPEVSLLSACGMSYYSITGAFMTQTYGVGVGTYGFVVNVMREFFTIILLPLLVKISKGSPIAGGAAGNMDTMLVPVTKTVGLELGVVALITGIVLTVAVPILLPLLAWKLA